MVISIFILTGIGDQVEASEQQRLVDKYQSFDIRTAPSGGYTGADMDAMYAKNGHPNSILAKTGNKVYTEAMRNGINPAFMFGLMIKESGWGTSTIAIENRNFGGIRATKSRPSKNGGNWAYFEEVDDGIEALAKLLGSYTVKGPVTSANPEGKPLRTFQEVINSYAPAFENDQPLYMQTVGKFMENLGQHDGGSILTPDPSLQIANPDGSLGEEGERLQSQYFLQANPATGTGRGVQLGKAPVGTEISNWVFTFSEGTKRFLLTIGSFLSAVVLVYMVVYILMHLVLIRNGLVPDSVASKLGMPVEMETFWPLMKRLAIGVLIISFFMTGLHVNVMAWIINFIANLPIF